MDLDNLEVSELKLNRRQRKSLHKHLKKIDPDHMEQYETELFKMLDGANVEVSSISPSDWTELNRMMTADVSPIPGMFSYGNSPYTKEIVDCLKPDHPSHTIAVMKGAQIGFSTGVIEAGIGWIISQNPGNVLFLVGHEDLVKDAMKKIDRMIDNSGIRHFIRSAKKGLRNNKSGDTDTMKEYPDGYLKLGIANHKYLRNISMQFGFIDDFESMKSESKESGSTQELIEQRFAAFAKKKKIFYISTPELKATSNIEPVYLMGDQRKWHVKAPCCGNLIPFEWTVESSCNPGEMAGITWETDEDGSLIAESVGYTCQKCGGFFDDSNKTEIVKTGKWIATAKPSEPGYYSYHISALYAPPYMDGWTKYVRQYMRANPKDEPRNQAKWKSFVNLVLGQTYEETGTSISASDLQENTRPYEPFTIPEKLSIEDGNGRICMLTLGSDLNGTVHNDAKGYVDDARLDWEIIAHAETGATYSVAHGSIGTFINQDKKSSKREKYSYQHGVPNSVWPHFQKILTDNYFRDSDGSPIRIFISGLDVGHASDYAWQFINNAPDVFIVGLKGDPTKNVKPFQDLKTFRASASNPKSLFLVESNKTKDILAEQMKLRWDPAYSVGQPSGYMNFPQPTGGMYDYKSFFSHFEAEHKIIDKKGNFVWQKKNTNKQNHLFDCRLYGMVVRDIMLDKIFKETGTKNGVWGDYVDMIFPDRV